MIGLMWKDLLCLRKGIAVYMVVAAAYLLMLAAGFWDISVVASVLAVIVCVLPCSCFSYDYIAKWDRFGLALPVSRAQVVLARYLTTALLLGLSALLLAVLGLLAWALGGLDDAPVYGLTAAVTLTIGMLLNAALLPLVYRFGAERARILLLLVIGGAVLVVVTVIKAAGALPPGLFQLPLWAPAAAALIIGAALMVLSYFISLAIYNKKEV